MSTWMKKVKGDDALVAAEEGITESVRTKEVYMDVKGEEREMPKSSGDVSHATPRSWRSKINWENVHRLRVSKVPNQLEPSFLQ